MIFAKPVESGEENKPEIKRVKVSMAVNVDEDHVNNLGRLLNHIDEFVDMNSWSEIESIDSVSLKMEDE